MLFPIVMTGAVLGLIFYLVGLFLKGRPLTIIGILLGVMFFLYIIRTTHLVNI